VRESVFTPFSNNVAASVRLSGISSMTTALSEAVSTRVSFSQSVGFLFLQLYSGFGALLHFPSISGNISLENPYSSACFFRGAEAQEHSKKGIATTTMRRMNLTKVFFVLMPFILSKTMWRQNREINVENF